ncbi:amidase [Nemania sp. FL0916]|nr:amidase [Nemania sp. FL0916]
MAEPVIANEMEEKPIITNEKETILHLGDSEYVLIPHDYVFISFGIDDTATIPFLVYPVKPGYVVSRETLRAFRKDVLDRDDVFQPAFAACLVFLGNLRFGIEMSGDAYEELDDWGTKKWIFVHGDPSDPVVPGPFVWAKGMLWQPWKVYYDFNNQFMKLESRLSSEAGTKVRVIVPSRCYFSASLSRPLDGMRVAVTASIDIEGHETIHGNLAERIPSPLASTTAHCVQSLINFGAIIVGNLKPPAFEITKSTNPPGDDQQTLLGGMSGSAAAIASYDWLDLSIGSDINGSVGRPAQFNGCHAIRPTTGIINTDGMACYSPESGMPGFYARDLFTFSPIINAMYGRSPMMIALSKKPTTILYYYDHIFTLDHEKLRVIDKFITALETSLQDLYKAAEPSGADHEKKFGKSSLIPHSQISKEERDKCRRRCEVSRTWLLDNTVLRPGSQDSLTIMVLPTEDGGSIHPDVPEP